MARIEESLDGGLWTSPDPAMLDKGQLSGVQNGVYLPGKGALQRARGRSVFGTASAEGVDVVGLRDMEFDNGDHYLVAIASTTALTAVVADTNNFISATAFDSSPSQLEVAHYRNRFYLLPGTSADASAIGTNKVAYLSATAAANPIQFRQHGMLPVIAAPSASASAGTFSQTVTGYYEYWTTEVAKVVQDGSPILLESAFAADTNPTTVFVSSTGMAPVISMPAIRNSGFTTHWRVYRSTKKDKESDRRFPTGFMIGEASTATANQTDTSTVASAAAFPASFNSSAPFASFASASSMASDNTAYASATVGGLGFEISQGCYGFNFGGFSGSVKGIKVEVEAYATAAGMLPVPVTVKIGNRRTDGSFGLYSISPQPRFAAKSGLITSSSSASPTLITLGGEADRWFASNNPEPMKDIDFGSDFMAVVSLSKPGAVVGVDFVRTTVYYSGSVDSTVVFPTVVYTFGDIVSQVAKNHPPSSASTGDLFEDSLVINDVDNPALIRWSFPGEPEYFPPTYFLDFETRENDRVRLIRVVNSQLVVMLDSSAWRVNYLPSERDSSFDRGKAVAPISRTYGCVNPMCACTFSMDGSTELLAFVSNNGIHVTEGYSFDTQTDGLDWRGVISSSSTSTPICLINDRERQELVFYFQNDSFTNETYKALHLSYAPEHLTLGPDRRPKLKISGLVNLRNFDSGTSGRANLKSAWPVQRSNGVTDIYLGYGGASTATAAGAGKVYRETGSTIPAQDDRLAYVTRRMYEAGLSNEWRFDDLFGYCGSYDGAPTISYTLLGCKTDDTGETTGPSKSKTLAGQKLHHVNFAFGSEGIRVSAVVTASAFAQEKLVIDGEGFGLQDSGR